MTKYGLRARVYIFTMLPTLIIGCLLASYFTFNRHHQLDQLAIQHGTNIIEPLAISAEPTLNRQSRERMKALISATHRNQSSQVQTIAVYDRNSDLFVTSNYLPGMDRLQVDIGAPLPLSTEVEIFEEFIVFRTPIWSESNTGLMTFTEGHPELLGYIALQFSNKSIQLQQLQEDMVAIIIVVFGLLISFLFSFAITKNVTQPISRIVGVVSLIRQGRLDARVDGNLTGELGLLQKGINSMARSLADYHEEMHQNVDQATSDLRETLEQIEIQNIELDIAKKQAQQAAQAKSDFLANMSHELRTPLNGVLGFAKQLFKTPLTPGQKDYLYTIETSANNLLTIISNILDFSKLDAKQLVLENIRFNLRQVTSEVLTLLAPSAHEKQLELIAILDPHLPIGVYGDPLRFQQILTNLIGNAIKFTHTGHVLLKIDASSLGSHRIQLDISVSDTGIGINEQQQGHLFQAFKQADASISREYGGTGLGLVITQRLVHQMGGEIHISSTAQQGSTFSLNITLDNAEQTTSQPLPQLQGCRLLIFEPHSLSREHYLSLCAQWGVQVHSCNSLQQFEQALQQQVFDTVLLGYSQWHNLSPLLNQIKLAKEHCDTLIVALNSVDPEFILHILQAGASHCLPKPLNEQDFALALTTRKDTPLTDALAEQIRVPRQKRDIRVLAVDDNRANLKLISTILSDIVTSVDSCHNGQEAVEISEVNYYDLIFMDIQMPILDGISASQVIRRGHFNAKTPIVAVTAHAITGEKEQLLSQGMDDYLAKPINEVDLIAMIERWCPAPPVLTSSIDESFDWHQALESAANKPDLALEMLRQLIDSFDELRDGIALAQADKLEAKELERILHQFHGGCAYTGVHRLKQLSATCETNLKSGHDIDFIEPELLELLDELDKVYSLVQSRLRPRAIIES